jgi:hypothetical protein
MTNADGFVIPKPEVQWNEEDEKKYSYDWKARNMLITALGFPIVLVLKLCGTHCKLPMREPVMSN